MALGVWNTGSARTLSSDRQGEHSPCLVMKQSYQSILASAPSLPHTPSLTHMLTLPHPPSLPRPPSPSLTLPHTPPHPHAHPPSPSLTLPHTPSLTHMLTRLPSSAMHVAKEVAFQINHTEKSFHAFAASDSDKENWVRNLTTYISRARETKGDTHTRTCTHMHTDNIVQICTYIVSSHSSLTGPLSAMYTLQVCTFSCMLPLASRHYTYLLPSCFTP